MQNDNYFTHPAEVWDAKKCERVAKSRRSDSYGTKETRPGRITGSASSYPGYGQTVRYNGGCVRGDKWFEGETVPLPTVPENFRFEYVPTWGTYLVKSN